MNIFREFAYKKAMQVRSFWWWPSGDMPYGWRGSDESEPSDWRAREAAMSDCTYTRYAAMSWLAYRYETPIKAATLSFFYAMLATRNRLKCHKELEEHDVLEEDDLDEGFFYE